MINAVAQFEREHLIQRTQAGLIRAKEQEKHLGKPSVLSIDQQKIVQQKIKMEIRYQPELATSTEADKPLSISQKSSITF